MNAVYFKESRIILNTDKGVKFFTLKNDKLEEKSGVISSGEKPSMYGVTFQSEDTLVSAENGHIYTFREDSVCDSKFKVSSAKIACIGFVEKELKPLLMALTEDGKLTLYQDETHLVE